jgi:outer membrane murein-binding lipoprotein Lpp
MSEQKLDLILQELKGVNHRFDKLESKVDNLEGRFDNLEAKVDKIAVDLEATKEMVAITAESVARLEHRLIEQDERIDDLAVGQEVLLHRQFDCEKKLNMLKKQEQISA